MNPGAALMLIAMISAAEGHTTSTSPVQKVIELIEEMKGKVTSDLAAEEKAMEDYSAFCDKTMSEKGYAIETAGKAIADLGATIADCKAQVTSLEDDIVTLGSDLAKKDGEVASATAVRKEEHATFLATEKELVGTVDQLGRAIFEIKKSMAFLQVKKGKHNRVPLKAVAAALSKIVDAAYVTEGNKKKLSEFLQATNAQKEDDDLDLAQPQAKTVAYESSSGGIVSTIEDMKGKAEEALSDARRSETKAQYSFKMIEQSLTSSIKILNEKKSDAASTKAAKLEEQGKAEGELAETSKTKAADETYVATLKGECEATMAAWDERKKSAAEELGALAKAKDILAGGVKVFVQFSAKKGAADIDGDDESDRDSERRANVVAKLKELAHSSHSFALMEMASAAGSDPFVKVKGLIEDMIAKLVSEANEEATQKAFCDEEIGKSKKSQAEKTATADKLKTRTDAATATTNQLKEDIKELEAEIAEIDSSTAEATKLRGEENAAYLKSSADFKGSASATEKAIVVLKEYYEGSLLQVKSTKAHQPDFGAAKSDSAHSIISVLEMAAEDFTKTYTEIEMAETAAVKAYTKLMDESKVAKATKVAEVKGKSSEIKSLATALANLGTDSDMVAKELDAVMSYLDKLKPQCESKVMSYAEKKAKREAEIDGLKEALSILDGSAVLLQGNTRISKHNF